MVCNTLYSKLMYCFKETISLITILSLNFIFIPIVQLFNIYILNLIFSIDYFIIIHVKYFDVRYELFSFLSIVEN